MKDSFQVETPYIPNEKGCRLVWRNEDEEERVVYLRQEGPKSRRKLKDLIHVV